MSAAAITDWKTIFKKVYADSHKNISRKFNKTVVIGVLFFQKKKPRWRVYPQRYVGHVNREQLFTFSRLG